MKIILRVLNNSLLISVSFLVFLLFNCNKTLQKKEIQHFSYKEIKIRTSYKLNIDDCLNWFTSFDQIKKTVIYKDKIISVGLYGGLCCLDIDNFKVDKNFSRKLNSDLYTDISVIDDTLFAELFDEIFFLDDNLNWKKYHNLKPIKYFNTLLVDNENIFYFSDSGEWGGILFVYNRKSNKTRALISSCPRSVINKNGEYYITACTEHMGTWGSYIKINNINKLKEISDTLRLHDYCWDRFYFQINDTTKNANDYIQYINPTKNNWDTAIISSFKLYDYLYHFVHANRKDYICKIIDNNFVFIDTIPNTNPRSTISYPQDMIIVNESTWSNGFSLIRDSTIYKIKFENTYIQEHQNITSSAYYTQNSDIYNNWTSKPGLADREIEFDFNKKYKIIGKYGNGLDGNYIIANGKKNKLKILSDWNFIDHIYVANGNLFLNFMNIGNINFKYNLIEITNIDRFVEKYSENE